MATGTTSEKIPNRWGRRVEDLKFLGGILKNYTAETPEIKKKKKKISITRGVEESLAFWSWKFHAV